MDNDLLKLLPKKAFKLIPFKLFITIGAKVAKSIRDKEHYENDFQKRLQSWPFKDIKLVKEFSQASKENLRKEDGEKILQVYFSQFFEKDMMVHLDLRKSAFLSADSFYWNPSQLHYFFPQDFLTGICALYIGFYTENDIKFDQGLKMTGMVTEAMTEKQKIKMKNLFYQHFGEGNKAPINFSLKKLHESFNAIFTFFLTEDIPLNPEFAVFGIILVTLYLSLESIPEKINVKETFLAVYQKYQV